MKGEERNSEVNSFNFSEHSSQNYILQALNTMLLTTRFDQIQGQEKLQEGKQVESATSCRNTCSEETSAVEGTGRDHSYEIQMTWQVTFHPPPVAPYSCCTAAGPVHGSLEGNATPFCDLEKLHALP